MAKRIFGLIGWLACALILAAAYMNWTTSSPYARWLAISGLVLILVYIASEWREIAGWFNGRSARYGALTAAGVTIVLGILVAVNYIGAKQHKRWDLTANKQFSLSDQSRTITQKLDAPLQIVVLDRDTDVQPIRDRLNEYRNLSAQVQVEYIDPERQPAAVEQYQVKQLGTLVLSYKGRTERVTSSTEQDITGALIKLVSGEQRKIYFTTGHGEKDTAGGDRDGYSKADESLKRENYLTDKLVLIQSKEVPADAAVVVVAGPQSDFFPPEIDALKAYLDKGGKLLLMIDPQVRPDAPPLTNLIALAHDWGMDVGQNVVVDVSGMGQLMGQSQTSPLAAQYPPHPATERFRTVTAYSLARSVDPVEGGVNGHTAQSLVLTSPQSWAETDIKALVNRTEVQPDEGKEKIGAISLAAAAYAPAAGAPAAAPDKPDAPKPETRVAVFGDSDFASNAMTGIPGNPDMFMNVIGWLSQQENLISIRPREADDRRLEAIPIARLQQLFWGLWLFVPALILTTGVVRWMRKG